VTKVKGDLGCIQRAFGEGVIQPWSALNFGDSSLAPVRRYMLPDEDEAAERAAAAARRQDFFADIKAMRENGFEVLQDDVDTIAKSYGVDAPRLPTIIAAPENLPTESARQTSVTMVDSVLAADIAAAAEKSRAEILLERDTALASARSSDARADRERERADRERERADSAEQFVSGCQRRSAELAAELQSIRDSEITP
jgi:hypothetical protein